MNKRGFTTVELIVSFGLVTIISLFLFQLIFVLKTIFIESGIKTKLLTKQAVISEKIESDFNNNKIIIAENCGTNCAEFMFESGKIKRLIFDRKENTITYGDYKEKLIDGSSFGNIEMTSEVVTSNLKKNNGLLKIKIPIYNNFFGNEDFGIKLVYQFNTSESSINDLNVVSEIGKEYQIFLVGNKNDISFQNVDYVDPGFYLYDVKTNDILINSADVTVTGKVGNIIGESYDIKYNYKNPNIGLDITETRTVTVVNDTFNFTYKGKLETFNVPIRGTYKIEAWGASGGGSSSLVGPGGYTKGEVLLERNDKLIIAVGGEGYVSTMSTYAEGGFNGGGDSGSSIKNKAASGGGASDVRLYNDKLESRIIVAGGGGGGGSRMDSSFKCNGGAGGGEAGLQGTCSASSYLGGGGSSSAGGDAALYTINMTKLPTAGKFGIGGNGGSYENGESIYSSGGAGGGYYGGGGGSRYAGGGGGSGYCSVTNCSLMDGKMIFPTPNLGNESGHIGNGHVKITLISINN